MTPLFLAALGVLLPSRPPDLAPFELRDGDRLVWIGSTVVEREQRYGYWETALLAAQPGKRLTVRNLGWSGDTVHGEARGRFDFADPEKCFRQLLGPVLELKPTVVFVSYGTNEAFEGEPGLPRFEKGLEKLLDALKPTHARVVLFSPMKLVPPAKTEPTNRLLKQYAETIRRVAARRGHHYADLFDWDTGLPTGLTENGMHLNEQGYRLTAPVLLRSLGWAAPPLDWAELEPLRRAVVAKNELVFHRWRPQNETYLFGFRKHEQGQNAREVAAFDALIARAEEEIDRLRQTLRK